MGLSGEDRPSVARSTAASVTVPVLFCRIPGDVLLLNAVLKFLILKLLLVSVGQSKEPLLGTAWAGKVTGQEEMQHVIPLQQCRIPVPHKQKRENELIKIV